MTVARGEVMSAHNRGEDDVLRFLVDKARGNKPQKGRLWLCVTTFRNNTLGIIEAGSLLETTGEPDLTFLECTKLLEDYDGETSAEADFSIKILTAKKR